MKRILFLLAMVLIANTMVAQNFSNKGKEFWIPYSFHVGPSNQVVMTLYITSDSTSTYSVEIFGGAVIQSGTITAGSVVTCTIPQTYFLSTAGLFKNKAVRVSASQNVVVYSYITRNAVSGATLCLPTNVLGTEYYSMNYNQRSNETNSNSYFTIIAVEDNTLVEITPAANTTDGKPANVPYQQLLQKGEIYQVLGTANSVATGGLFTGVDMTGSRIRSISSGTGGCKRIAVFSGAGKMTLGNCTTSFSADNLYQQLYPVTSWGKVFLTVPSYQRPTNYFRIVKQNAATVVKLNGNVIPAASFVNNRYYEFYNTAPNKIEASDPIAVAQYFTTQGCDGNAVPFDPDMVVLNPVEQNIKKVTLVSSNLVAAGNRQHHFHVIIDTSGSALTSFKFDGVTVPTSSWVTHPNDPQFAYLYLKNVAQGYHTLESDSGFNALAYGYADAESYAYSAGSNVKDLYQYISIINKYATVKFPAACKNSPFKFSMTFPYQPASISWEFGATLNGFGIKDTTINLPSYDSTWVQDGRTLYMYVLNQSYTIPTVATYPVKVYADNKTTDGCSGIQLVEYELQIFNPPVPDFTTVFSGCVTDPTSFTDKTNPQGRTIIKYSWDFGDNSSSSIASPVHQFTTPGPKTVRLSAITDVGCLSDTLTKIIDVAAQPKAVFGFSAITCEKGSITISDTSTTPAGTLNKWNWDLGDGTKLSNANANDVAHSFTNAGQYTIKLMVESSSGCKSPVASKTIDIYPKPLASFVTSNVCLPLPGSFTSNSSIADGSSSSFKYLWDFGDGQTSTSGPAVTNTYAGTGPYDVKLTVTSKNSCVDDTLIKLTTIYTKPVADFTTVFTGCVTDPVNFSYKLEPQGRSISTYYWNFGDNSTATIANPSHQYATAGAKTVKLVAITDVGCQTDTFSRVVDVAAQPTAVFGFSKINCEQTSLTISDTSTTPAGVLNKWNWDLGDGTKITNTNANDVTHTFATAGLYKVTLMVESTSGCKSPVITRNLVINPKPLASFTTSNVCLPIAASLTSNSSIADGSIASFKYSWDFGDGNISTAGPIAKNNYASTGPFDVRLTVTSNNSCVDDTLIKLTTIYPKAKADFDVSAEVCIGKITDMTDKSSGNGSTISNWYWSFGDGATATTQNTTHQYALAGTYIDTLYIKTDKGCYSDTVWKSTVVNPLPTAAFTQSSPLCERNQMSFTDKSISNAGTLAKWNWDFGDTKTSTLQNPSNTYDTANTYPVTLIVESSKGCISPALTTNVKINFLPRVNFGVPEVCFKDPVAQFTDSTLIPDNTNGFQYKWYFDDPVKGRSSFSTQANPSFSLIGFVPAKYQVALVITSLAGCIDSLKKDFFVNGAVPKSSFNVNNPLALCSNKDVTITDGSTVDFGNIGKLEIYWDYGNNPTIKTIDDVPNGSKVYNHAYPYFSGQTTKTFLVKMVSYSGISCMNEISKTVTINGSPNIVFNPITPVCEEVAPFIINTASERSGLIGTSTYSGLGITSPAGNFNPSVAKAGTHVIRYSFQGANSCSDFKESDILIYPTPLVSAGPDKTVLEGGGVLLEGSGTGNNLSYLWSPPTALDNVTIANPKASPLDDITYTLSAFSSDGCVAKDNVFVKVLKAPKVPNAFSPNGDGINDTWIIEFLDSYPGSTVEVFNRYGQRVYSSTGYPKPWDGTVNGNPLPMSTYYWIINPKNGRKQTSGSVTILR